MQRIVFRPATSRTGKVGYVADLIDGRAGFPAFPIVPYVLTSDEIATDVGLNSYVRNHPGVAFEMGR